MSHPDWVGARAQCNVNWAFAKLHEIVLLDLKRAVDNGITAVKCEMHEGDQLVVERAPHGPMRNFFVFEDQIRVSDESQPIALAARVEHRPEDGTCVLFVSGQNGVWDRNEQMELWQFARLALEPLLFPLGA